MYFDIDDGDGTEDYNVDDYFTKLFSSVCTNCLSDSDNLCDFVGAQRELK